MSSSSNAVLEIPFLGSGLGYRRELKPAIFGAQDKIDFVEIITEQFINHPNGIKELEELCEIFQVIPHGISLSIGSDIPLDLEYLRSVKCISDFTKSPYYSEHLCMTRVPGINIGHLSPLWFTEGVLQITINNVSQVQEYLGKPIILENITYLFEIPKGNMSQAEFFGRLVEATGCGILLDVTNLYINSINHCFDPFMFLDQIPLEKIVQVHLAGGYWADRLLIDSHSELVHEESWNLLKILANKTKIKASIVEHDDKFPAQTNLLFEQVTKAKEIILSSWQ